MSLADFNNLPDANQGGSQQTQVSANSGSMSLADFNKLPNADQNVKMVGPQGQQVFVPQDQVVKMRQQQFAVTADNPNVIKAVDYNSGKVNYILPQEAKDFQSAGSAIVEADGGIRYPIIRTKEGVIWQDPLEEQKAHERVFQALNAEEKARTNRYDLKEFGKAGLGAVVATTAGVTGASAAGALPEAGGAILRYLGAGALPGLEEAAGKAILNQGAKWVVKKAAPYIIGGAAVHVAKKTGLLDSLLELF